MATVRTRTIATYPYRDEEGRLLFEVHRREPKAFVQRRPVEGGGWAWGLAAGLYVRGPRGDWYRAKEGETPTGPTIELAEAPRVLYCLPEILEGVRAGSPIYVVEGEKDVDTARRLGLVATCNSGGAGKWLSSHSAPLAGATVRIVPDRDKPGEEHARLVASSLRGVASSVEILSLPVGKDLSELVEIRTGEGRSPVEIRQEIEALGARPAVVAEGPLPLRRPVPDSDPYPVDVLPSILRGAVEAIARRVQVPESLAASSVLAAASFAAQAHVDVLLPSSGQVRPVSLYLLSVAESGDRKTTADEEAGVAIAERERELRAEHAIADRSYRDDRDAWEKARAELLGRAKGYDARRDALASLDDEPEAPPVPILRVAEPTWEGLVRLFGEGWPSLALFSGEGGEFIGGHAMNAENRLKTSTGLSKLWDGSSISRTRGGEGARILPGRRLAVHLLVQPLVADGLLGDRLLWSQGLLSRFLVSWPRSLAGSRFWKPGEAYPRGAIDAFSTRVLELLRRPFPFDPEGGRREGLRPRALSFTPSGADLLREFYNAVETRVGPEGELDAVRGVANKAVEHASRLAAVLTVLDNPEAVRVELRATEAGIVLAQFYLGETLRIREVAAVDYDLLLADRLLSWIRAQGVERISLRRILRLGPNSIRDRDTALRLLRILEEHRHLEPLGDVEIEGVRVRQAWRVLPWEES